MGPTTDSQYWHQDQQPGLEVAAQQQIPGADSTAPEHWDPDREAGIEAVSQERAKTIYPEHYEPVPAYSGSTTAGDTVVGESPTAPGEKGKNGLGSKVRRRPLLWAAFGVIVLLIIVGAVLGGVLGSRAIESDDEPAPSSTPSDPKPSPPPAPESLTKGSALTVTGRRVARVGYEIYMYYQGSDGQIRHSRFDNSTSDEWPSVSVVESGAGKGTPLAATSVIWGELANPQVELFYRGSGNSLLGRSLNNLSTNVNLDGSIGGNDVTMHSASRIATYYPWIIFQNPDSQLVRAHNYEADPAPTSLWNTEDTPLFPAEGSRLAMVPTSSNFTTVDGLGGFAAFYEGRDGKLTSFIYGEDKTTSVWGEASFPEPDIQDGSPIAAMALARGTEEDQVNTYVLYRNPDGNIDVVYNDKDDEWKIDSPDVFQTADDNSDLACLTMPTTSNNGPDGGDLFLEELSGESRCYFVEEGDVKEVVLSESGEWELIGTIAVSGK